MGKTKRMIYIWEENLEFYDELENKSEFLNYALRVARLGGPGTNFKVEEVGEKEVSSNAGGTQDALEAMKERDAKILAEYRKKMGLYDPTKVE